jgi:hypothetical protein
MISGGGAVSKHHKKIKHLLRTESQIGSFASRHPATVTQKRLCKVCNKRPRYIDFKRCFECRLKSGKDFFGKPLPTVKTYPGKCHRCNVQCDDLQDWIMRGDDHSGKYPPGTEPPPKHLWCPECVLAKNRISFKKAMKKDAEEKAKLEEAMRQAQAQGKELSATLKAQAKAWQQRPTYPSCAGC